MNLFDLVNRLDRSIVFDGEASKAQAVTTAAGHQRAVIIPSGSRVRVVDAHQLTALSILSADLGWSLLGCEESAPMLAVTLHTKQPLAAQVNVGLRRSRRDDGTTELRFVWPREIVVSNSFDIELSIVGNGPLTILVGPFVNMREHLLPYARGVGIEVGPGLRPLVLPSEGVDVTYIEQQDPREWLNLYNKTGDKPEMPSQFILDRYVRSSAVALEGIKPESLDFVFSNHVFEHLPNPVQVMKNWLAAVKPGGMIVGVIPDPRFTFDCRQPPTTNADAMREETAGGHDIGIEKYLRWCRYTEPKHTPEDLIRRSYSIHVNFFTPESFRTTMAHLEEHRLVERVFVYTAPNHKDFGFALRKARGAG